MGRDKLTAKQAKFVEEYLVDLNASAAARRAKYSAKTAFRAGQENMQKPAIQAAIQARRLELAKNIITPEEIIQEYAKIARTDIKDFLRFGTEKIQIGFDYDSDGNSRPVYDYRQVVEARPSDEVDGTLISEVSISDKGTFKFKLHDKLNALEKIAKHLGMFVERSEVSHTVTIEQALKELDED